LWELSRSFAGAYKSRRSATLQVRGANDNIDCVDVGGPPSRVACGDYRDCSWVHTSRAEARPSRFAGPNATGLIASTLEGRPPGRLVGIIEVIRGFK
jgi:hypothetical protein